MTKDNDDLPKHEISPSSKKQIDQWIESISNSTPLTKPISDPNYSEFWIEMHKTGSNIQDNDINRIGPLGTILSTKDGRELDIREYLQKKSEVLGKQGDWSEDAFFEIGPDFSEMYPDLNDKQKLSNVKISIHAKNEGKLVKDGHYQALFNKINIKKE